MNGEHLRGYGAAEGARLRRAFGALTACFVLVAVGLPAFEQPAGAAGDPCAPVVSRVACENSKPGDVSPPDSPLDSSIEGFTTDTSVNPGQTVRFKINTTASAYSLDIYRVGWYQGIGTRKMATVTPSASLPQIQPSCLTDATTGLVDCGNWAESASWNVPSDAVSGIYVAYLRRPGTSAVNEIIFTVRDDLSHADVLVQTSDTTWQAYNRWGGNSLYFGSTQAGGAQPGRAYKVSYNRPLDHVDWHNDFWASEAEMVHFLERNGYDVSYQSGVDTDRLGAPVIQQHKTFMSSGHDEYWSGTQRANVQAARDAGVNLAFFSGNEMFWKTRYEPSIDGSNTSFRTLVTYKETLANAKIDPNAQWTGTFRDPRFSPPADGGQPENALTGNLFTVNGDRNSDALSVPQTFSGLRQWRNTSVATLPVGGSATFPVGTLGYEWNEDKDNGFRPPGDVRLSSTTVNLGQGTYLIRDFGSTYTSGTAIHSMTLYKAPSGARVFNSGTVQWSWGIDPLHATPSTDMMQATVNILADLGAQPATLQAGLVAATASTDTVGPSATITSPSAGATINTPAGVTITGTASDSGGGVVAGVEVSTDGSTWHPAQGTSSWSYTWVPGAIGNVTIRARAVDDSANIGTAVTRSVTVALQCPCSVFGATAAPTTASSGEVTSLELGMRFRPDVDGVVNGVRFYKGAGNTGTHTGSLWTDSGQLLTTVTFSGETATGWQQATFPTPIAVTANTTYVISYHAPNGNYAADAFSFSQQGVDNGVLHAPAEWSGGNGVFAYGASSLFPNGTYNGTNYWVDVVFAGNGGAPTVLTKTPPAGATGLPVSTAPTVTFSKAVQPATIVFTLKDASNANVPGTVSYAAGTNTATFTPSSALSGGITYTASVSGAADSGGNVMSPVSWSFTTAGVTTCPCTIWPVTATPGTASANDSGSVELGVRFTADVTGVVNGVRFYKGAGNTGTHTGTLWSATGQQLATATFSGETASGWQQVTFSSPVPVSANTAYVASYHAPNGHYAADSNTFAGSGVDNAPLHAPATTGAAPNGVYIYGASTAFPNQTWQATNYWVDVSFTPGGSGPADTTPPTVTASTPASGATGVAVSTAPTATFSEPVQAATIGFTLKDSTNANVAGTSSYNAGTNVATFTPTSALAAGVTYTANVTGAKDTAGNTMAGTTSWSFTTAAVASCPCSLWSSSAAPGSPSADDPNSVELGVRFTADVAGVVNGVRFYKGAGNTGTHTGTLWTSSGQQLATATFSGETASGWQQVTFSSPVAVAANTAYIASYHAPNGGYAHDVGYFQSSGVDNGSLHALADTADAPNGVYAYGASTVYPDQTFQAANYWVDVLFTPADSTPPTVTARTPASGATGVLISAAPTATFSEAVQAATISFTLKNAANTNIPGTVAYNVGTNTATFTPGAALATGTVYTASVTGAKDTAGNTMAGTTSWSFTTQLLPTIVTDTTTANFTAGTQSSTYVAESSDGEVSLAPATGAEFGGTSLPAGWTSSTNASGGTTVVAGGTVTVDGARAYVSSTSSFGRWLEISGTFTSANPNQYLGFGTTLASGTPWAAFGTKADGNLYARSQSSASAVTETNLGTAYLSAPHVFRVEWNLTTVVYKVDGVQVASHSRIILTSMRPVVSDGATGGPKLVANWVRMGPYTSSGTFTSRVLDAGTSVAWGAVAWNATVPSGGAITVRVRSGNVATPNGTWTSYTTVTNGGSVASTNRYRQYQVSFTRATDGSSPTLNSIDLTYSS